MTWKEYLDEMKVEFLLKASVIPRWAFKKELTYIKREIGILSPVNSKF